MSTNQCNTCGGYESIVKCSFCPTMICIHCKRHHSEYCELLQKAKKRGEGPTVANAGLPPHRAGHTSPVEPVWETEQKIGDLTPDGGVIWTNVGLSPRAAGQPLNAVLRQEYVPPQGDAPTMDQLPVYDVLTGETKDRVDVQIDATTEIGGGFVGAEIESALDAVKDLQDEN